MTELVTSREVCDRIGVGRNRLGEWYHRYVDFPSAERQDDGRFLFRWESIRAFLDRHGLPLVETVHPEHPLPTGHMYRAVVAAHTETPHLSHAELAAQLGTSRRAVENHTRKARKKGDLPPASATSAPLDDCGLPRVSMWTDASLFDRQGGWAAIIQNDATPDTLTEVTGARQVSAGWTGVNLLELLAVCNGVRQVDTPSCIVVFTDSKYVVEHYQRAKDSILPDHHTDAWASLLREAIRHHVTVGYVRGHAWSRRNKQADEAARGAAHRQKRREVRVIDLRHTHGELTSIL